MSVRPMDIVIVEPESHVCRLVQEALRHAGYAVRATSNVWEAQKLMRAHVPAMIVSSFRPADLSGVAFRDQVLREPALRDVPFLFLTEKGDVEQEITALRSRVDDFIEKPVNPVVLVERVKAVLARRAVYDEMVRVDPLTRLLKRASFEQEVVTQIVRAINEGRTDSVVMLDPEEVSRLNREHGWTMGDLMLTCLAGIICTNIRAEDIAGRLDEDKFVLYLPHTPATGAQVLVQRVDQLLKTVSSAISGMMIGLAAGIIEVPGDAKSFEPMLARCWQAIETGKRYGKNRVTLWRETGETVAP